ncbi:SDR family NAD(P)-dependent oxidoreductase [Pedobacter sp. AW31-3R]|uniref:SDR family NAD(P)-dependent oxidoreductase n=1 Tax=Pedobacter sp. AW31-3R TaxID=3445781 RepID=UPI003FA14F7E
MSTIQNKIAVITGGSRGLGRDMALRITERGLDVIITYNSNAEEALKVVELVKQQGRKAAALPLNVGDIKGFSSFRERLTEMLTTVFDTDHFDFLVNNAGIGGYQLIGEVTEDFFDELYNIHFKGVYFLTQELIPVLNDGGGIINVSSGLTRVTFPRSSAYAAMKGAIEVFTRYVAKEFGSRGIRANTIAPGAIMTDFGNAHLKNSEDSQKMVSSVTALGRPGVAEDIGGVVAFLCSEDARWVNGQRIEISGGMQL